MDTKPEDKKDSTKMSKGSKEFKPSHPKPTGAEGAGTPAPEASTAAQADSNPNQFDDPNSQYLQYVNYYLNQGLSNADAEAWAKYYMDQQNYIEGGDQTQADPEVQQPAEGSYQEEYPAEKPKEDSDGDDFEIEEFGAKTKKPQGEKKKEKYRGKHNENYNEGEGEGEEGYYDELGFYYNPDGSFYDPDGYFFDAEGYDEFGGYYDDNANYISPDGKDPYTRDFKGSKQSLEEGDVFEAGEEDGEDKYTKEYINYIINSKYYDDLDFLNSSKNEWAYLKIGNLAEGTIKTDLLKYFGDKNIETKEITIMMSGSEKSPVANLEIYKIPVAIEVLKECGNELRDKRLIIEVDNLNEKLYNGTPTSYNNYEYDDETDARYTKYDPQPKEYDEEAKDEEGKA